MTSSEEYVNQAIGRLEAGEIAGSHATGVFNKAANNFEKLFRDYYRKITSEAPGKLTLGQLIYRLENRTQPVPQLPTILVEAKVVNRVWKEVKHGREPSSGELLRGFGAMKRSIPVL